VEEPLEVLLLLEALLEVLPQFGEAADDEQLLVGRSRIHFLMLENPGVAVRDENRVQPGR